MAKIAIFIPSLAGGGAERVAVTFANQIAKLGHECHLLVATNSEEQYAKEIEDSVNIHRFEASRVLTSIPALTKHIKIIKPAVILAIMDYSSIVARLAITLSRRTNTRLYIREAISIEFKQENQPHKLRNVTKPLIDYAYRHADGIVSPSKELALSIKNAYPAQKNIKHINNPVVTDQFDTLLLKRPESLPWQKGSKTIISAGRLSIQKDFITLIKAFNIVRRKLDCKLIILGEGSERKHLLKFITDNNLMEHCYLPGFIPNPLPYFRQADLFVLSSKHEGLPNALIQALACGTKAVSTNCPTGPAEILDNGNFGILVPVGDYEKMAVAIEKSLTIESDQNTITQEIKYRYDAVNATKDLLEFMRID